MTGTASNILSLAEHFAAGWYAAHSLPQLTFHNLALAQAVSKRAADIGRGQGLSSETIENARVAALFSQTGYAVDYNNAVQESLKVLSGFLENTDVGEQRKSLILNCLVPGASNSSEAYKLFWDAWYSLLYADGFEMYQALYRSELQLLKDEQVSKSALRGTYYSKMRQVRFHFDYTRAAYQALFESNLAGLESRILKEKSPKPEEEAPASLFSKITRDRPIREIQTFFRTSFEYHTKLIDISDNKARIMINVNSVLVSILISLLTYNYNRIAALANPMALVPILVALVAALGSLVFAVLSSRPNMPRGIDPKEKRLYSFMDFTKYGEAQYKRELDEMFRDGANIIDNMAGAIYALGKILERKYKYLTISYNIFMVGFVVAVTLFLFSYL